MGAYKGEYKLIYNLNEMSLSRSDAMDRCISLGEKFIEYFHNIYHNRNSTDINHWISEMSSWYNSVKKIRLKSTNKPLLINNLMDWFFTAGSNPEEFLGCDLDELEKYNNLCIRLISGEEIISILGGK